MSLVTISAALQHLRLRDSPPDELEDVARKLFEAEAYVLAYVTVDTSGWTEETVPREVQSSIKLALDALWHGEDVFSPTVINLLVPYRDPTLA